MSTSAIDGLADPGSFREFMGLVGSGTYDDEGSIVAFTPKGSMDGFCKVDGRKIIVSAGDFTVRGGSGSGSSSGSLGRELSSNQRALQWRLPYVRMLDSAGGSVRGFEEMGRTYLPDGNVSSTIDTDLLRVVPVVSALMGSVAGLPAVAACMSHFTLMVKGISQLFPGGPPVVRQALGYDITKEDLGDERIHVHQSGSVDNLAETEEDAFRQIRQWLSYLPPNVYEMAPRVEPTDDPNRRDERLRRLVPRDPRRAYDGHKAIESIVDQGSFFEVAPFYGRARITGLARMNGYSVGIMANNPMFQGGSTDVAGGRQGDSAAAALRHVPPAADHAGRRAGVHGWPGVREARHRARRRAVGDGDLREPDALADGRDGPGVRRRRPVSASPDRDVPALRLALGPLGLDADSGRHLRGISPRDRQRPRPGGEAPGDRAAPAQRRLTVPHGGGDRPGHHRPG